MGQLRVREGSESVRVEISGILSGSLVEELRLTWQNCQSGEFWRQFVVDITGLTGYDLDGHALLHQLHRHGATFGAGTPGSLSFLKEITKGVTHIAIASLPRRSADRSTSPRPRHSNRLNSAEAAAGAQ
jgi:hypothetical protein